MVRSVHPALFRDPRFTACSAAARVFFIGLVSIADDRGGFPANVDYLRRTLMPADGADPPALLNELAGSGLLQLRGVAGGELSGFGRLWS